MVSTRYWHSIDHDKVQCEVCPHACKLAEGKRGICFVRSCQNGALVLDTYGRSSGFCIDPIEKKPLYHFYPGSAILSFGTAGCNLKCKFCQNWDLSHSKEADTLTQAASPKQIAQAAADNQCRSVAYTYNDPIIFLEYAIDIAKECRELNIKNVAVSSGYMCKEACQEFYQHMDAANIDLKAFSDSFYKELCGGTLQPVLDTLLHIRQHTQVWLELTTLLIPGKNDSDQELDAMTNWIVDNLGTDTPIHFSAFHPAHKLLDIPPTPGSTLARAREIAIANGLRYAYTGNIRDTLGGTSFCPKCNSELIVRGYYEINQYSLSKEGQCKSCQTPIAGVFAKEAGSWGSKRLPVGL